MRKSTKVVALDIHKDSITVALAGRDREGPKLYGTIPSTGEALSKLCSLLMRRAPLDDGEVRGLEIRPGLF